MGNVEEKYSSQREHHSWTLWVGNWWYLPGTDWWDKKDAEQGRSMTWRELRDSQTPAPVGVGRTC